MSWLQDDDAEERRNLKHNRNSSDDGEAPLPLSPLLDCKPLASSDTHHPDDPIVHVDNVKMNKSANALSKRIPSPGEEWDPFATHARAGSRPDAFARLLQGASSKSTTTPSRNTRDPGVHGYSRSPTAPSSSWDPFTPHNASSNKENAFSRMLSSPGAGSNKSRASPGKGARIGGKRKRPVGSSSSVPTSMEATRFCPCPVCGKRVSLVNTQDVAHHEKKESWAASLGHVTHPKSPQIRERKIAVNNNIPSNLAHGTTTNALISRSDHRTTCAQLDPGVLYPEGRTTPSLANSRPSG